MNYEFQEGDLSIIIGFPFAGERLDLQGRLEPTFIQPFDPGIGYYELQIAGVLCLHIDVFGVRIPLPLEDRLADLCRKHLDSGYSGSLSTFYPPAFDVLEEYALDLRKFDLSMDAVYYHLLAEACLPVDADSLLRYVQLHYGKSLLQPLLDAAKQTGLELRDTVSAADVKRILVSKLAALFGTAKDSEHPFQSLPADYADDQPMMGILSYPNSD